jgi:hypothetical protein
MRRPLRWLPLALLLAVLVPQASAQTPLGIVVTWAWPPGQLPQVTSRLSIERSVGSGPFVELARVEPGVTSWTDRAVEAGITYCYRIVHWALGLPPPRDVLVLETPIPRTCGVLVQQVVLLRLEVAP